MKGKFMDFSFLTKLNQELSEKIPILEPIANITFDGSVNRFDSTKKDDKAIWVCIHANDFKGNVYYNAVYGTWRQGVQYTCSSYDKSDRTIVTKEFRKAEKEQMAQTQEKLEKEKQDKYKQCRDKWTPFYFNLPLNAPVHTYLKGKKLNSNFHARVDGKDVLFVPAWNAEGLFVGGQRIFLDPVSGKFEKRYTFGIEKAGSFCPFGDIRKAEFIYIAEGYATAASIYMAFKNKKNIAVVCVWDTSNILPGASAVRKINQNCNLVFAADKDIHADPKWHNIGERKAKQAANKFSNAVVKTVKFDGGNDAWSDYNDLHQFEGLEQVAKQLHVEETDFIEIIPLGFNGDKYYYFSTSKKQILEFSKSDHNQGTFMLNAPPKYWGDRYGYVMNKDGEKTNNPDWKQVIWKIGIESNKAGIFNHSKIRGVGAWEQDGEIIVNLGDKLYYKEEFFPLFNNGIKSDYFYQSSESVALDFNRPLGNSDCLKIVEAFQMLKYKNKSDYIIVLGWLFSAQVFASLSWRPHIWFTGERGSGKSTILEYISSMVDFSIMVQGSTAAGIRQRLGSNAVPIIYDESEPDTEKARDRMAEILEMARQSSTRSKYEILRGSAGGKAISYNTNTTFCMGSIQLSEMNGADTSRFFVIEMANIKEELHETFIRLENAMSDSQRLSTGLFVRAVNMYGNHVKNIETAKQVIKSHKIEARQADQLAPIIAGYFAYFSTGEMDEKFVLDTINEMDFSHSEYVQANDENESQKCLDDIFGLQIPGRVITVGQIVDRYQYEVTAQARDEYDQMLGIIGLRYFEQEKEIFIASSSSSLRKQMERISKFSDYKNILKRHDNYKGSKKCRVGGMPTNGIVVSVI
jgi:putative DNA primase/helicase